MSGPASDFEVDVAIVGAGVVGLACAARLAREGRSVAIVERHDGIAREVTSRNSEVIHAGIYYPRGSLKAELCVRGRELLYARCRAQRIPHRKLGKLIVASEPDEVAALEDLQQRGRANGVPGLEILDAAAIRRLEPAVRAHAGLLSPETGIVDGHALCLSLLAEAEAHGTLLLLQRELVSLEHVAGSWRSGLRGAAGEREVLGSAVVVNAAGLASDRVAELAGLDVDAERCRLSPCKGDYFSLASSAPLRLAHLVYPVPTGPGLGVHATLDLAGRIRFGPDAEFVPAPRYDVDPDKASAFARAIRRYWPEVREEWLSPDYAGVRPRLASPGEPARDFVVREEAGRRLPGLVSCIGIESPGLTAALAIAERVAALVGPL